MMLKSTTDKIGEGDMDESFYIIHWRVWGQKLAFESNYVAITSVFSVRVYMYILYPIDPSCRADKNEHEIWNLPKGFLTQIKSPGPSDHVFETSLRILVRPTIYGSWLLYTQNSILWLVILRILSSDFKNLEYRFFNVPRSCSVKASPLHREFKSWISQNLT